MPVIHVVKSVCLAQGTGTVTHVSGVRELATVTWDDGTVQGGVRIGKGGEYWLRLLTSGEAEEEDNI